MITGAHYSISPQVLTGNATHVAHTIMVHAPNFRRPPLPTRLHQLVRSQGLLLLSSLGVPDAHGRSLIRTVPSEVWIFPMKSCEARNPPKWLKYMGNEILGLIFDLFIELSKSGSLESF
jgi:hypothetical protein